MPLWRVPAWCHIRAREHVYLISLEKNSRLAHLLSEKRENDKYGMERSKSPSLIDMKSRDGHGLSGAKSSSMRGAYNTEML